MFQKFIFNWNKILKFILEQLLKILFIIGSFFIKFNTEIGKIVLFALNLVKSIFVKEFFFLNFLKDVFFLGFNTIPLIAITSIFTGAVLTLQLYDYFKIMGIQNEIAKVVVSVMSKDLGPVLAGLMIVARVGSSIASEISYMKSTNQLDVLKSLSVNHFRFILFPKLSSIFFSVMYLYLIALICGIIGSYLVSIYLLNFNPYQYKLLLLEAFDQKDIIKGIIKLESFGLSSIFVSYYLGFNSQEDKMGIINATSSSIIFGSILVLILNFVIVWLF